MHRSRSYQRRLTKLSRSTFLLFLAVTLIIGLGSASRPLNAFGVTSAEKQAEADVLMKELDALQTELLNAQQELSDAVTAEATAIRLKDEAKAREDAAIILTGELQTKLGERAVQTYRDGEIGYLDVLFGSSSFTEFLTTWEYVSRINDQDAKLTADSKAARKEAEDARTQYSEQERIATQKREEIAEIEADLEQKTAEMQVELEKMNEEIAELLAEEEAAAEAARAAAAAEASGGAVDPEIVESIGTFTNPCPSGYVSSGFGWRDFDQSFHKGIDLAAGEGTPIYAARGGTVIISGYSGSAGNWIVIAHGNGITTKYMHAVELYVSAGETVSEGQLIAGVGNTGNSFGAHLHFQIEINGTALNPYPFIF